ncbi:hypothetical protein, partial [Sabulibacter ruber]|uniref:hypothetical protein n=1 Tax=Sabulibacter ruber TaxID=2811901 RepID=UPI001A95AF27
REGEKKIAEALAKREVLLTFAAPSGRKVPKADRAEGKRKKVSESIAKREVLLTFAPASGRKPPLAGRGERKRKKKLSGLLAE